MYSDGASANVLKKKTRSLPLAARSVMSEIRRNNTDGNNRLRVRYSQLACSNGLGRAAITPRQRRSVTDPVICATPSCMFIRRGSRGQLSTCDCETMQPDEAWAPGAASLKQAWWTNWFLVILEDEDKSGLTCVVTDRKQKEVTCRQLPLRQPLAWHLLRPLRYCLQCGVIDCRSRSREVHQRVQDQPQR